MLTINQNTPQYCIHYQQEGSPLIYDIIKREWINYVWGSTILKSLTNKYAYKYLHNLLYFVQESILPNFIFLCFRFSLLSFLTKENNSFLKTAKLYSKKCPFYEVKSLVELTPWANPTKLLFLRFSDFHY